jgi:Flp pilus assembly protein TadG
MRGRRLRGDAGVATTELVIVTPAFLFLIMMIIQTGLYFHAASVASAAAQDGASTAAIGGTQASVTDGEDRAEQMLDDLAARLMPNPQVRGTLMLDAQGDAQTVRMRVDGDVIPVFVFPGANVSFHVSETAESAVERFRPADETPPGG